jgi:hypothetical protein
MGRKSLQVKGYSPESIKALFNSDDRYKIGMRLYVFISLEKYTRISV